MKQTLCSFSVVLTAAMLFAPANATRAATLTYDADTVTTGAQDGGGIGWNASNVNFWNGSADVAWPNTTADVAVFGTASGAAASVTVGAVTTNSITFNAPGSGNYTLAGGTITLGGATSTIAANVNATIGSVLAGGGTTLFKTGTGTLTLSGSNTFTSQLAINAGTWSVSTVNNDNADGALGNNALGVIINGPSTLEYTGTTAGTNKNFTLATAGGAGSFQIDSAGTALTLSGVIDGAGYLNKTGAGSLVLSGPNTYAGDTVVSVGTLGLAGSSVIPNSTLNLAGGSSSFVGVTATSIGGLRGWSNLALLNDSAANVALTVGANNQTLSYGGSLSGGGSLAKTGTGTQVLTGSNSYGGGSTVSAGILQFAKTAALPSSGAVSATGTGTLAINAGGTGEFTNGTSGAGTLGGFFAGASFAAGTAFGIDTSNAVGSLTYAGSFAGSGITKLGSGTLTLTGASTYNDTTLIKGGTLIADTLTNPTVLDSSTALAFGGSGTFQLKGFTGTARLQTISGLTLTAGAATIDANNVAGGTSTTIDLRGSGGLLTITRSAAATVDFKASTGTFGTTAVVKTHQANDATGILGAWATVKGGTDWAINNGSDVVGSYTGYTAITGISTAPTLATSASANYKVSSATTNNVTMDTTGTIDINTLMVNDATTRTIDIANGATQGILRFGAVGGILTLGGTHSIGVVDAAGTITAGGADNTLGELIVNNATQLTINSLIANNGTGAVGLTKTGTGTLRLTNNSNTYTGGTTVLAGTLQMAKNAIVFFKFGGSLTLANGTSLIPDGGSSPKIDTTDPVILPSGSVTISVSNGAANGSSDLSIFSQISGSGGIIATGQNNSNRRRLELLAANTFTGGVILRPIDATTAIGLVIQTPTSLGTGTLRSEMAPANLSSLEAPNFNSSGSGTAWNLDAGSGVSNAIEIASGANLNVLTTALNGLQLSGTISGAGSLTAISAVLNGTNLPGTFTSRLPGTLILSGVNTYTGTTTVASGNVTFNKPGTLKFARQVSLYNNTPASWTKTNIKVNADGTLAFNVGGTGEFTTSDVATLLTNLTTSITNNGLMSGSRVAFDTANAAGGSFAITGVIPDSTGTGGGSVGLTKQGANTLAVSGTNTYTGATIISAGTLQFGKKASLYNSTAASWTPTKITVESGATLALNVGGTNEFLAADLATFLNITHMGLSTPTTGLKTGSILALDTTNASGATFTPTVALANPGTSTSLGLTKLGTGTLLLNLANTYSGATLVNGGTLQFSKQASLYNNSPAIWLNSNLTVKSGATLAFNVGGTDEFTTGDVTTLLTNLATNIYSNGFLAGSLIGFDTSNAAGGTFDITGAIANSTGTGSGSLGLAKLGTNTLILSATNTYTGATTVTGGTLLVNGSIAASSGTTVSGSGVLGGGTTAVPGVLGNVTMDSGSTLSPGASVGTLNAVNLSFNTGSSFHVEISSTGGTADKVVVTGAVSITGTSATFTEIGSGLLAVGTKLVLVDYSAPGASLTGTFTGLAEGAQFTVGSNTFALSYTDVSRVTITAQPSYATWAFSAGLTGAPGFENGTADNPDHDGRTNLQEFAFDGNPLSGFNDGKTVSAIADPDGVGPQTEGLTLTLPMLTGATFSGSPDLVSNSIQGIQYRIQGSDDLSAFTTVPVAEVTPALSSGLPSLSSGYAYRTFRLTGAVSASAQGFIRAGVATP